MALVLPTVTLTVASRAEAQVQQLPSWAVTEFKDLKSGNRKYGQAAADAVAGELAKTNRYDVVAQDTVNRAIETLGLTAPLDGLVNLSRVGTEALGAGNSRGGTIVSGEVAEYRVDNVAGGKQARVAIRTVAYDVASVLPVNGALELGESTVRGGNVTDEALITDAIQQAAANIVRTMQGQQLPSATILNTQTRTALLNQGTRSGFKTGDTVIITRGPIQVGTARIGVIEPDQAEITYERVSRGVAPGDRVRAIFTPPALPVAGVSLIKANGTLNAGRSRPRGKSNNATLISALLVVGLVGVLLGGGNGSGTGATASVTAEPTVEFQDNTSAAVKVKWTRNGFYKGNGNTGTGAIQWQVYRSDVSLNPLFVVKAQEFTDSSLRTPQSTGYLNDPVVGGTTCKNPSPTNSTIPAASLVPLRPGQTYVYSVEAVYQVTGLDLPGGDTGGNGGNTGTTNGTTNTGTTNGTTNTGTTNGTTNGTTTGTTATGNTNTGTTAGNTGGGTTSGNGNALCYFLSGRTSSGRATPLPRPTFTNPQAGNIPTVSGRYTFQVTPPVAGGQRIDYVLEFAPTQDFAKKSTVQTAVFDGGSLEVDTLGDSFPTSLRRATTVWFRVGVRVHDDRPGPVAEKGIKSRRFIYSLPRSFNRSPDNPTPP